MSFTNWMNSILGRSYPDQFMAAEKYYGTSGMDGYKFLVDYDEGTRIRDKCGYMTGVEKAIPLLKVGIRRDGNKEIYDTIYQFSHALVTHMSSATKAPYVVITLVATGLEIIPQLFNDPPEKEKAPPFPKLEMWS